MKPGKIIYCLSDIMNVNLNVDSLNKPSQEECEVGEHLAEVIISICNRQRFRHEEKITLDFYYKQYNITNDENEEESSESESGSDYEVEDDLKKELHELFKFSLAFMRCVVDYTYANKLGQRRRT